MFHLKLLGGASLLHADGTPLSGRAIQRHRLGLLALLAVPEPRALPRERLMALLWPETDASRARALLNESVYVIRKSLGEDALVTIGEELRLNGARVESDVAVFAEAVRGGRHEEAIRAYGGPLLDGFFLSDALEWERWADGERERLRREFQAALQALASEREAAGDLAGAVAAWRRAAAEDPTSGRVAERLMRALAASGEVAAAMQHAQVHAILLREEFGLEPDPGVSGLVDEMRRAPPQRAGPPPTPGPTFVPALPPAPDPPASAALPEPRPQRRRPARWLPAVAAALLLAAAAGAGALVGRQEPSARASSPASLVVLPFVDMSADGASEYFSDGLTEELIHELAQVEGLRVVARTSAFAFKGKNTDVREIGERLDVASVLEGSVRRSGERLRVTVQLVDTRTGYHLWSETFDREMRDVFAVQDEISRSVAARLRGDATPREVRSPRRSTPEEVRAYNLYLQGRFLWNQRRLAALEQSLERFREAAAAHPTFARAHAGMADSYNSLVDEGWKRYPEPEIHLRAKAAAREALRLDPTLAEAHTALAHINLHLRNWPEAEAGFRRALELNPGYATAHQMYGNFLTFRSRFDDGIAHLRTAQQLDPLSLAIHASTGSMLFLARRFAESEAQLRTAIELDSLRSTLHVRLALTLVHLGRYAEAEAEVHRAIALSADDRATGIPMLGLIALRAGRRAEAERAAREVRSLAATGEVSRYYAGAFLGAMGQYDAALDILEDHAARSSSALLSLPVDPIMDPLRAQPRFQRLAAIAHTTP